MSQSSASRATLADLLPLIEAQVPAGAKRDDMKSAVRKVAQVLGRSPAEVEIDPKVLGIRLKRVSPASHNITKARWQNVCSLFRQALALATAVLPGKSKEPIADDWLPLFQHTSLKQSDQTRVSRLLRWLSERGIGSNMVTEAHLADYRNDLDRALLSDPEATWRDTVLAWNRAIKTVPGWPALSIALPSRKKTWALPWSAFPASLKQDVDGWLDRLAGRDFADDGPARPVRPSTLQTREYQLRSFASALVHRGRDASTLTSLAVCLSLENYDEGLRYYVERNGKKTSSQIAALAGMLKGVAKHWLNSEDAILKQMSHRTKRLAVQQTGMTTKNRDRLRPFHDRATVDRFLNLPNDLIALVERGKVSKQQQPVLAEIAVAIEILLMAPIRISNLVNIDLDRHLFRVGPHYHLVIDGTEVKNSENLESELPRETTALIDRFIATYRKAAPDNRALFVGRNGGSKKISSMRKQLIKVVKAHLGLDIHPHLFRHIAGMIYLEINPGNYQNVSLILGHKNMQTTMRNYLGLQGLSAARHFSKTMAELRASSQTKRAG